MSKIWKPIPNYEGFYEVSESGEIRNSSGKILSPNKMHNGYMRIRLCMNGIHKTHGVHRLVASAFIPNPNNYPQVNHKDENRLNNHYSNLEWCTNQYNNNYGNHSHNISVSNGHKVKCVELDRTFHSMHEAERELKVCRVCIAKCLKGKQSMAGGYHWTRA